MFKCDHCHNEYGGIRGLAAGSCPRCSQAAQGQPERRDWATRPFAATAARAAGPALSPVRRAS